jgi:YidC/Oxa1 family membrane protein insertase
METQRALLAVVLSLVILLGFQYFFMPSPPPPAEQPAAPTGEQFRGPAIDRPQVAAPGLPDPTAAAIPEPRRQGRDIPVETQLYSAVISETGGGIKSFRLKNYRETLAPDADLKELITSTSPADLPLYFTWGVEPDKTWVPVFEANRQSLLLHDRVGDGSLVLTSSLPSGIEIVKTLRFASEDYRIHVTVDVHNTSQQALQGAPFLQLTNRPFSGTADRFLFTGPALLVDDSLREVKVSQLQDGSQTYSGLIKWAAYEDPYFMNAILPARPEQQTVRLSARESDQVSILLTEAAALIPPQGRIQYEYTAYIGPKQIAILQEIGHDLATIVNFGWFDFLAKPMLYLMNFFYGFVNNYGIAIIMVTIFIKLLFWPISHKGMKSMKRMQKLQPMIVKLREKYSKDREKLNQEMVKLYQTHKINPVGGCLPMLLQIPVFFALYKVLLQTIELRHAPFMLWINDLSAPDRLYLGFDIPYLGGLPVLTLLMGASMFLQMKMMPTSLDPIQAKIMMFLPVIFTFLFVNFASGLVLYWFCNNILTMFQQHMINRKADAEG